MPADPRKILRARRNGIVNPVLAWRAAKTAGIPYFVACAILEAESSGGQNVYGHDDSQFSGFGAVTPENYAIYRRQRDMAHSCGQSYGMQGVGPCQLTYFSYQNEADALGGCWLPLPNMLVGFGIIRGYRDDGLTLHEAFAKYNGSEAYADQMDGRVAKWREILREKS